MAFPSLGLAIVAHPDGFKPPTRCCSAHLQFAWRRLPDEQLIEVRASMRAIQVADFPPLLEVGCGNLTFGNMTRDQMIQNLEVVEAAGIEPACPLIKSGTYDRNKCLRGALVHE